MKSEALEVSEFPSTYATFSYSVVCKSEEGFRIRQIVCKEGFESFYYCFGCFDVELLVEDGSAERVKRVSGARFIILGPQVVRVNEV